MFELVKPFVLRGRDINTQADLDRCFINPGDTELIKSLLDKGVIKQTKKLDVGEKK